MGSSDQLNKFDVKILRNDLNQFKLVFKNISLDERRITESFETESSEEIVISESYQ